ncbi:MAG: hypothetical protein M3M89_06025 [Thermoproteota archaeon]|nr:hypothetical protein [Thermoproteota archaeon]
MKPKQCPNCDESNKPESKFCSRCKFVLSFDAFNEATKETDESKKKLERRVGGETEKYFKQMLQAYSQPYWIVNMGSKHRQES